LCACSRRRRVVITLTGLTLTNLILNNHWSIVFVKLKLGKQRWIYEAWIIC
jgi:hypothetical protein